ncbi:YdhR family protein [Sulfitobacter aestuariivivens]|uniref:YdhR family protein n=1 Tax=Sulfitobacter aestuariivivens TaxID=2766981 RepID=A0A927HGA1_9RHOB|nr:YdhR family protein [Sulfitobacter aestuariivivens]MBD3664045.1 YdhR family protein [Sulfitobacter aestuariivivens]
MTKQTQKTLAAAAIATTLAATSGGAETPNPLDQVAHVIQFVRFESTLPRESVLAAANERRPQFEAMPGLVQKYYLEFDEPNTYGGIYIWESKAAMAAFRETDLFKGIPAAYGIASQPRVDIIPILFPLR